MNQKFYTMIPRSREVGIVDGQPAFQYGYVVMQEILCTQKTVLRFHPTAKTRAVP